jgi:hypothetical protein
MFETWVEVLTQLISTMLEIEPSRRPPATQLRSKFASLLETCQSEPKESCSNNRSRIQVKNLRSDTEELPVNRSLMRIIDGTSFSKAQDFLNPFFHNRGCPEGILLPKLHHEVSASRMSWIMEVGMDAMLPYLHPEHRLVFTRRTEDIHHLLEPLLDAWEEFRSNDANINSTRELAKDVYQQLKISYRNDSGFNIFWRKKMDFELDDMEWQKFKNVTISLAKLLMQVDQIVEGIVNDVGRFLALSKK